MTTPMTDGVERASTGVRVLLADDEPHLGYVLQQYLQSRGHDVTLVRDGLAALEALQREPFDVALLDVVMPELDGLEVLRRAREESTPPEILVITGNGTVETTLAALGLGAYDVLSKPYRMAEIDARIRRAWEKRLLVQRVARLQRRVDVAAAHEDASFITAFAPLKAVLDALAPVATGASPVFITGERGSGRRALARWLHAQRVQAPGDRPGPFVELTRPTAATLAGQEGGRARTDAGASGALDAAAGGTLYIPEVAALDPQAAAWLAGVLESGLVRRLGGRQPVALTARVVAASVHSADVLTREFAVPPALLARLRAVDVELPPLRARAIDIGPIARAHLARQASDVRLGDDALAVLEAHRWPGNVRELVDVLDAAHARTRAGVLDAAALTIGTASAPAPIDPRTSLADLERRHIAAVLEQAHWHQGRAAELLGISPKTLYRKIREYGFRRPSGRGAFAEQARTPS
ncbi:MAG: response regulator [Gemmatimonadetes bacterium]|nr:response regulator [Gemmatimonadota bacterium]